MGAYCLLPSILPLSHYLWAVTDMIGQVLTYKNIAWKVKHLIKSVIELYHWIINTLRFNCCRSRSNSKINDNNIQYMQLQGNNR